MVGGGISGKGVVGVEGMTFCSERVNCNFFSIYDFIFKRFRQSCERRFIRLIFEPVFGQGQ